MSFQIDFRTLPRNVPSLCIPRVFPNWSESRIRRVFDDLEMGEIQRIDVVSKTTEKGDKFNRVFVHFKSWFSNQNADMARERLLNGKEIKIVYDDPWFWKVSAYRESNKNSEHHSEREERPRVSIRFDDDNRPNRRPVEQDRRPNNKIQAREDESRVSNVGKSNTNEVVDKQVDVINEVKNSVVSVVSSANAKDNNQGIDIDYGSAPFPIPKRRQIFVKKEPIASLKIDVDEGEAAESE